MGKGFAFHQWEESPIRFAQLAQLAQQTPANKSQTRTMESFGHTPPRLRKLGKRLAKVFRKKVGRKGLAGA